MVLQDTKKINQQTYDAIASQYEENYGTIPASFEYAKYLAKELRKRNKPRILDLGCGTGTLLKFFEDTLPQTDLIGVDFSEELLKIAKNKLKRATLINSDFATFQDKDKFDAIIATFSLIHSTDDELKILIPKIYEMLVENGYFYVSFILGEGEEMEPEALDPTHKTYFNFHSKDYLTKLVTDNHFEILKEKIFHSQDEYENEDDLYLLLKK